MTLLASSAVLALAWFASINIAASVLVWLVAPRLRFAGRPLRPDLLLILRLAPAIASSAFVAALFLPAHWLLEPEAATERFGIVLQGLALVGAWLALRSMRRMAIAGVASRRMRSKYRGRGLDGRDAIEVSALTNMTLAGIFRPTILVGAPVRAALSSAELDVALDHERSHRIAWDNLKRFAMFCAPDVFGWSAASRRLEQEWNAEAECLADARAVRGDASRALNLASALVKVARLAEASPTGSASPLWSPFSQPPLLEARVHRLVDGPSVPAPAAGWDVTVAVTSIAGLLVAGWTLAVPHAIYGFTEALVRLLP